MSEYKLVNEFILVKKLAPNEFIGNISLSSNDRELRSDGIVVKISDKASVVKPNDVIIYYKHSGIEATIDNEEYIVLDENEILSIKRGEEFYMTNNRILIKENNSDSIVGKVLLSESDTTKRTSGCVISKSNNIDDIEVGDNVMFSKYSGVYVTISGVTYKVLDKKEIFIIL